VSVVAIDQSGFDPVTAEEPVRTVSSSHQRGGEVIGSGAVVKGAAEGAVAGVIVETQDAVLLLQGHQSGRGWTLVIERATGHLSASAADAEGTFALAGSCTAE
jgi:hypothetical protein